MRSVDFAELANFRRYERRENHVLVVRMRGKYSLYHVVAVDLGRSRILESKEPCPLFLSSTSIRWCAGGGDEAKITSVREIVSLQT